MLSLFLLLSKHRFNYFNFCILVKKYISILINNELNQIGIKIDMYRQEYRFTPAFAFIQAV